MWVMRISLELMGDSFSPKVFLGQLSDSFIVFHSHEATDLKIIPKNSKITKPGTYDFGSLSILAPSKIAIPEHPHLADYENWYIDFIERYKELMDKYGVTEINLYIEVFHSGGQCNFEIFSKDALRKIALHGIAVPISFYSLTYNQIVDLLRDAKYSEQMIKDFVEQG